MEAPSPKIYMALAIITFLAYAAALGFAYAQWNEIHTYQPTTQNIFN